MITDNLTDDDIIEAMFSGAIAYAKKQGENGQIDEVVRARAMWRQGRLPSSDPRFPHPEVVGVVREAMRAALTRAVKNKRRAKQERRG